MLNTLDTLANLFDDSGEETETDEEGYQSEREYKRKKKGKKDKRKEKEIPKWIGRNLLRFPGYVSTEVPSVSASQLTLDWMANGHFNKPMLVTDTTEQDDMYGMISVEYIRNMLGPNVLLRTIDVNSQNDGPTMTLDEWYTYWVYKTQMCEANPGVDGNAHVKHGKKLLNVVSLSLANTELEHILQAPQIVQKTDLVRIAWPEDCLPIPKAELYALMSPKGCYTDWHVDFGGSSVWYHVISGSKYFALAPPTPHNLKAFAAWASSSKQSSLSLLPYLKDPVLYSLKPGQTMLIPGGWPHAVYTPSHSLVVGGNFLHPFNLNMQLEVWRLEDALRVPPKCRFPLFKTLMWHVANYCHSRLRKKSATNVHKDCTSTSLTLKIKSESGVQEVSPSNEWTVKVSSLEQQVKGEGCEKNVLGEEDVDGSSLSEIVKLLLARDKSKSGLTELISTLKEWLSGESIWDVPSQIEDPLMLLCDILADLKRLGCLNENMVTENYDCELPEVVFNEEAYKQTEVIIPKKPPIAMSMKSSALSADIARNGVAKLKKPVSVRDRLKKKLGWRR